MSIKEIWEKIKTNLKENWFFGNHPEQEVHSEEDYKEDLKNAFAEGIASGEISKEDAALAIESLSKAESRGKRLSKQTDASITILDGDRDEPIERADTPKIERQQVSSSRNQGEEREDR